MALIVTSEAQRSTDEGDDGDVGSFIIQKYLPEIKSVAEDIHISLDQQVSTNILLVFRAF